MGIWSELFQWHRYVEQLSCRIMHATIDLEVGKVADIVAKLMRPHSSVSQLRQVSRQIKRWAERTKWERKNNGELCLQENALLLKCVSLSFFHHPNFDLKNGMTISRSSC